MITYEVNLTINNEILDEYYQWLIQHVKIILAFEGFISADIAKEKNVAYNHKTNLTVRYYLDSEKNLHHYLNHHAHDMREDGIKKFGNQFTATRRIFIGSISLQKNVS